LHSRIDFASKLWVCPFCLTRNQFPQSYTGISETQLPAELFPSYSTIEYALQRKPASAPVFVFVVDTCVTQDNLNPLRNALEQTITQLPEDALVGLITFGTTVRFF
jgi:protein transport protein SEC23